MLIAGLSFLASAQAPSITVVSREGRKPLPVTVINNQDYVAVDDVNTAFAHDVPRGSAGRRPDDHGARPIDRRSPKTRTSSRSPAGW